MSVEREPGEEPKPTFAWTPPTVGSTDHLLASIYLILLSGIVIFALPRPFSSQHWRALSSLSLFLTPSLSLSLSKFC